MGYFFDVFRFCLCFMCQHWLFLRHFCSFPKSFLFGPFFWLSCREDFLVEFFIKNPKSRPPLLDFQQHTQKVDPRFLGGGLRRMTNAGERSSSGCTEPINGLEYEFPCGVSIPSPPPPGCWSCSKKFKSQNLWTKTLIQPLVPLMPRSGLRLLQCGPNAPWPAALGCAPGGCQLRWKENPVGPAAAQKDDGAHPM